jgi:hypothetical protein
LSEPGNLNRQTWCLHVNGEVKRPLVLRLHVIAKFESHSVTVAPECAGNGRSFHRPRVPGTQWKRGAVGNAQFSGPRLRDLLLTAGLKTTARHVHGRAKLISSELKCRRMAAPPGQTQSWKRSKPVMRGGFGSLFGSLPELVTTRSCREPPVAVVEYSLKQRAGTLAVISTMLWTVP